MTVIPSSYLVLVRARKALATAYDQRDWQSVQECDEFLGAALTQAFDDPERDPAALTRELDSILQLYSSMVRDVPVAEPSHKVKPELVV